eukprot:m.193364 g.193364  ORF g.193364 m.193364 type:complete len:62 (-) comp13655_c2_seq21:1798-1983(-)
MTLFDERQRENDWLNEPIDSLFTVLLPSSIYFVIVMIIRLFLLFLLLVPIHPFHFTIDIIS